jgi:hypothetical protein
LLHLTSACLLPLATTISCNAAASACAASGAADTNA